MKILFLCTLNAVRSPIAKALAERYAPGNKYESAGLIEGPVDYLANEVMDEIGIDISTHEPKAFYDLKEKNFDLVICLANESNIELKQELEKYKLKYEFWSDIPSPGNLGGSRLMRIFGYREIRDRIKARIKERLG